jgi:hypothetical protein
MKRILVPFRCKYILTFEPFYVFNFNYFYVPEESVRNGRGWPMSVSG